MFLNSEDMVFDFLICLCLSVCCPRLSIYLSVSPSVWRFGCLPLRFSVRPSVSVHLSFHPLLPLCLCLSVSLSVLISPSMSQRARVCFFIYLTPASLPRSLTSPSSHPRRPRGLSALQGGVWKPLGNTLGPGSPSGGPQRRAEVITGQKIGAAVILSFKFLFSFPSAFDTAGGAKEIENG